ncbi:MAG: family 10 glycosylhydrolase [Lentisphaeraceae bacterium]|nr:family 10 glycosylhydrolase [Lentisphaeraceae bacterium]
MKLCVLILTSLLLLSCGQPSAWEGRRYRPKKSVARINKSKPMRAMWVATVTNMDWPSKPGLTVWRQKHEARQILDIAVKLKFTAVIFQVRPHSDAFYKSPYEPWSSYLTGKQGVYPGYDPLQYWIDECHKRGLELHAWFNPFRLRHPAMKGNYGKKSIAHRNGSWCYSLAKGYAWLDPGRKEVRDYSNKVIMDVARRYDVDGIHLDDYFYPYAGMLGGKKFPDSSTYNSYRARGGSMTLADWRRNNINLFVRNLGVDLRSLRKKIPYGISPFGIWRPGFPRGVKGLDAYEVLFADSLKWMQQGWVDYLSPQLYWPTSSKEQDFTQLLDWWRQQNIRGIGLYPGLALYKATGKWKDGVNEIRRQLSVIKQRRDVNGYIYFSASDLKDNPKLLDSLARTSH